MSKYILHLETSTKVCSVALSLNGVLAELIESKDDAYAHGEKLTIFIENVLQKAGIQFSDLSAISMASGPGSYTGLRIGVSVAKGLCYALQIPLIAIDTLSSLNAVARIKYPLDSIACLLDARRMEVYSAIFSNAGELLKSISADVLTEESYAHFDNLVCIGDGAEKTKSMWQERQYRYDDEIHCSAIGQIQLAYSKFKSQEFEDVAYFEPFYLKDFYTPMAAKK